MRWRFEQALISDIRRKHALAGVPCVITTTRGRVFLDSDDWRRSCEVLSKTFGVVSFSPVARASSKLEDLTKAVLEYAQPLMFRGATFAIRPRRTGSHPYTSQKMGEELGAVVLKEFVQLGVRVALDNPEVELFVEVREKEAYIYSSSLPGPGGMPKGTQGRILSVVENPRGVAATWLMMKRGCNVTVALENERFGETLSRWDPDLKTAPFEEDIFSQAKYLDCLGIALEWGIEDFGKGPAPKGGLPVFYPLVGMNRDDVGALLERITR